MNERLLRLTPDALNADGEFAVAARLWTGDVVFSSGSDAARVVVREGRVTDVAACAPDAPAQIRIVGPADGWAKMLLREPPAFYQDVFGATIHHGFTMQGAIEDVGPYYPALRRLIDMMRAA